MENYRFNMGTVNPNWNNYDGVVVTRYRSKHPTCPLCEHQCLVTKFTEQQKQKTKIDISVRSGDISTLVMRNQKPHVWSAARLWQTQSEKHCITYHSLQWSMSCGSASVLHGLRNSERLHASCPGIRFLSLNIAKLAMIRCRRT